MITTYMANIENNIMFGKRYSADRIMGTFYIALSTTPISSNGAGMTEPNDPNYSRIMILNNDINFTVSSGGVIKNSTEWRFPMSTKAWSPVTHWAIMDSLSGGNMLYYDAVTAPINVDVHQELYFNPNSIVITRSGV